MIPRLYIALALAALVAGAAWQIDRRAYQRGHAAAVASCEAEKALALAEALRRQKDMIRGVDIAAQEAQDEQDAVEDRLAGADRAVDRLREAVASANLRADSATAAASDGATARTLLAECVGQYRDVARDADRLRAIVIGLQGYARAVSR